MRGAIAFIVAVFLMLVLVVAGGLFMDVLIPELLDVVNAHEQGTTVGWADHILRQERAMLVWVPVFFIGSFGVFAVLWYLRRERRQTQLPR